MCVLPFRNEKKDAECLQCGKLATRKEKVGMATAYFCEKHSYETFKSIKHD